MWPVIPIDRRVVAGPSECTRPLGLAIIPGAAADSASGGLLHQLEPISNGLRLFASQATRSFARIVANFKLGQ